MRVADWILPGLTRHRLGSRPPLCHSANPRVLKTELALHVRIIAELGREARRAVGHS